MNSVAWSPARFSVEVVTLYKYAVITDTSDPHVSFSSVVKMNTFTYM